VIDIANRLQELRGEPTLLEVATKVLRRRYPEATTGRTFRGIPLEQYDKEDLLRIICFLDDNYLGSSQ
jgi:hypothetical protein